MLGSVFSAELEFTPKNNACTPTTPFVGVTVTRPVDESTLT